jgi:hypothetical protein
MPQAPEFPVYFAPELAAPQHVCRYSAHNTCAGLFAAELAAQRKET